MSPGPATIAFVVPHLGAGGAQKVASLAASRLADEGHSVTILVTAREPARELHRPHPDVDVRSIWPVEPHRPRWFPRSAVGRARWAAARVVMRIHAGQTTERALRRSARTRHLRRALTDLRPDVVLSFLTMTNVYTLMSSDGLDARVVVSERNDPVRHLASPLERDLRRSLYPSATVVTCNSPVTVDVARSELGVPAVRLLPNPLELDEAHSLDEPRDHQFLYVGRLVPQKDVATLLRAMALLLAEHPGWTLVIAGDGPEEGRLRALAAELGIADAVRFLGYVADTADVMRHSHCLVLPSLFEGTPNAVLEAYGRGLCAIVSDASPGPVALAERVSPGLVFAHGDSVDLARCMSWAIDAGDSMTNLRAQVRVVAEGHSWSAVRAEWLAILLGDESPE